MSTLQTCLLRTCLQTSVCEIHFTHRGKQSWLEYSYRQTLTCHRQTSNSFNKPQPCQRMAIYTTALQIARPRTGKDGKKQSRLPLDNPSKPRVPSTGLAFIRAPLYKDEILDTHGTSQRSSPTTCRYVRTTRRLAPGGEAERGSPPIPPPSLPHSVCSERRGGRYADLQTRPHQQSAALVHEVAALVCIRVTPTSTSHGLIKCDKDYIIVLLRERDEAARKAEELWLKKLRRRHHPERKLRVLCVKGPGTKLGGPLPLAGAPALATYACHHQ